MYIPSWEQWPGQCHHIPPRTEVDQWDQDALLEACSGHPISFIPASPFCMQKCLPAACSHTWGLARIMMQVKRGKFRKEGEGQEKKRHFPEQLCAGLLWSVWDFRYLTAWCQSKALRKLFSWGRGKVFPRQDEIILLLLADTQPFDSQRWSRLLGHWKKGDCSLLRFAKQLMALPCICCVCLHWTRCKSCLSKSRASSVVLPNACSSLPGEPSLGRNADTITSR